MRKSKHPRVVTLSTDFASLLYFCVSSELGLAPAIQTSLLDGSPLDSSYLEKKPILTHDRHEFRLEYLRNEVFSKYPFDVPGVDRKRAAIDKFVAAEQQCRASNSQLVDWSTRPSVPYGPFARARRIISSILGKFNRDELPGVCGFGPGASTSLRRASSSQQNKWERSTHITALALPYYDAFYRYYNGAREYLPTRLSVVEGNKVTTVPKNSLTDRVIAIEPDWNMFFQKGIGSMIRRRLQRKVGLLTPQAQDINKSAALKGSCAAPGSSDDLATIDLSSASDNVSLALCEALLPADWFQVLMELRSPVGRVDGKNVSYEKISSMGNGFTFELETLLFFGLCRSVCEDGTVLAYGDDIIVPAEYAQACLDVLEIAGFTPNRSKTFITGPFRESCGGHYLRGHDVSPFYVRRRDLSLGTAVALSNEIFSWRRIVGDDMGVSPYDVGLLDQAYTMIKDVVPRKFRGPEGIPGCLWTPWDQATPEWCTDTQSWRIWTVQRKHRYADLSDRSGGFLYKLWENSPELRASLLAKSTSVEKASEVYVDREQWV